MAVRKLIPYAGYEPTYRAQRRVPVDRALELREQNLSWKQVAWKLTVEFDRYCPFTADGVQAAVIRAKKKETV